MRRRSDGQVFCQKRWPKSKVAWKQIEIFARGRWQKRRYPWRRLCRLLRRMSRLFLSGGAFCSILYDMIFHCFSWRHVCDAAPLGITSCRNCTSTKRTQFESPERRFALIGPSQGLSREESYCTNFAHRTPYFRCPMGDFHGFLVQFVLNETAP